MSTYLLVNSSHLFECGSTAHRYYQAGDLNSALGAQGYIGDLTVADHKAESALRHAFPTLQWEREGYVLEGFLPKEVGKNRVWVTVSYTSKGIDWFATIHGVDVDYEGWHLNDPVKAVRIALTRAGILARTE